MESHNEAIKEGEIREMRWETIQLKWEQNGLGGSSNQINGNFIQNLWVTETKFTHF